MSENPSNTKGYIWGLRKKILLSMVGLLLLLGLSIALTTHAILLKVLKTEFKDKALSLSRSIAANSLVDVLTQHTSRLKQLIDNEKELDKDIAYLFIIDSSGHILTHTFDKGFPIDLLKANTINLKQEAKIQLLNTHLGLIYDIASPILLEKSIVGQVRLGILQNSIQRAVMAIDFIFIAVTALIVLIGIFLAYKLSSLITKPISKLVQAIESIQGGDFSIKIEDIDTNDEIGLLALAFKEMISRLNQMVEEKKSLTLLNERNRIALDFHDTCAQDLANIIKRLELAQKLISIDPARALEELNTLIETTRLILDRSREVIFDFKSVQDTDFDLLNKLKFFIRDYERISGISVKLNFSGGIDKIPCAKAKSVFYIITEALTNARKHALAKNVELILEYNNNQGLTINIKDDGKGFDVKKIELSNSGYGKLGLISMRQRAVNLGGALLINSSSNQGTEISLNIPLADTAIIKGL